MSYRDELEAARDLIDSLAQEIAEKDRIIEQLRSATKAPPPPTKMPSSGPNEDIATAPSPEEFERLLKTRRIYAVVGDDFFGPYGVSETGELVSLKRN